MAAISISGWAGAGDRTFTLTVVEQSYDSIANTSVVKWTLTVSGGNNQSMDTYVSGWVNGTRVFDLVKHATDDGGYTWNGFPANVGSTSGTLTISHNADGQKTIGFAIEGYAVQYSIKSNHNGSLTLTNIDRTAPTITQADISNIDVTSFTISATSNVNCDSWDYSLNNGSSWTNFSTTNETSASTTVTGLTMNTDYTVLIRARKTLNQIYGISGAKSAKTLGSSTITTLTDATIGSSTSVTWTPLDKTFKYKLTFSCGAWSYTTDFIVPNQLTPYTYSYSIPMVVCNQLPNATAGTLAASLTTYTAEGVQVGVANSKTAVLTVPSSVVPTISSVTLEEGTPSGFGVYAKSLSTVKATVSAAGAYSSTVANIVVKVGNNSYIANSSGVAVSEILQTYGSISVVTTVTDSRGRTATDTKTITVYDYFQPTISMSIAINSSTNTVVTTVTGSIAPVNNLNAKSLVIQRKRLSDESITTHTVNPLSSYNYSVTWTQTVADIATESYEYTAIVTDTKQSVSTVQQTAIICISRLAGGRGVTFFQEAENEGFWVRNVRHDITAAEYIALATKWAGLYAQRAYAVGEWCKYNNAIYQCSTAITVGEAWNAAHWTAIANADMRMYYVLYNFVML